MNALLSVDDGEVGSSDELSEAGLLDVEVYAPVRRSNTRLAETFRSREVAGLLEEHPGVSVHSGVYERTWASVGSDAGAIAGDEEDVALIDGI